MDPDLRRGDGEIKQKPRLESRGFLGRTDKSDQM